MAAEMAYCGRLMFSLFDWVLIPFQQTQEHRGVTAVVVREARAAATR